MRPPSLPILLRSLTLTNLTRRLLQQSSRFTSHLPAIPPAYRNTTLFLTSMPTIPLLGSLFSSTANKKDMTDYPIKKTDAEWQAVLSPEQFRVIREKGTEAPYVGEYDKHMPAEGVYVCFLRHFSVVFDADKDGHVG